MAPDYCPQFKGITHHTSSALPIENYTHKSSRRYYPMAEEDVDEMRVVPRNTNAGDRNSDLNSTT